MNNNADKWLTLAEAIPQSTLSEPEARRIVKRFGKFLGPRNFGDIIKYPPDVAEAIVRISHLHGQGWSTEDIMETLARKDYQPEDSLNEQLREEVNQLLNRQDQACRLMQSAFDLVQDMMADMTVLTAKLAETEAKANGLRKENQSLQAKLAQHNHPEE